MQAARRPGHGDISASKRVRSAGEERAQCLLIAGKVASNGRHEIVGPLSCDRRMRSRLRLRAGSIDEPAQGRRRSAGCVLSHAQ